MVINFIVKGFGRGPKVQLPRYEKKGPNSSAALKGKRDAFFRKLGSYMSTNIYDYDKLESGNIVEGPAIIEMSDTTVVIPPGEKATMDEYRNILI